jgi:hypothetical protein
MPSLNTMDTLRYWWLNILLWWDMNMRGKIG